MPHTELEFYFILFLDYFSLCFLQPPFDWTQSRFSPQFQPMLLLSLEVVPGKPFSEKLLQRGFVRGWTLSSPTPAPEAMFPSCSFILLFLYLWISLDSHKFIFPP